MKEVISLILVADPKTRISANELKRHPYLESLFKSSATTSTDNGSGGVSSSSASHEKSSSSVLTYEAIESKLKDMSIQDDKDSKDNVIHDVEEDYTQRWSLINTSLDHELGTLKQLNAFDLVNQCGGFGMEKLFSPHTFYQTKISSTSESSTVPILDTNTDAKLDGKIRFGSSSFNLGTIGCYNFTSPIVPALSLINEVYSILTNDEWTHELTLEESKFSGMIRSTKISPKGMIGVGINIYILCTDLSLLQIVRGKGDRLEWNKIFNELVEKKFVNLLNGAKDGEAKKVSQH
jgi:serine/threonine protein kinase